MRVNTDRFVFGYDFDFVFTVCMDDSRATDFSTSLTEISYSSSPSASSKKDSKRETLKIEAPTTVPVSRKAAGEAGDSKCKLRGLPTLSIDQRGVERAKSARISAQAK